MRQGRSNAQLADAARLQDFRDRMVQELRQLSPVAVSVLRTTRFRNWTLADAWSRFSLEATIMLAAGDERIPSQHVVAEDAAGTVPCAANKIPESAAAAWGVTRTRYRKERASAFAVALTMARGEAR